jgi:hypothetical protein
MNALEDFESLSVLGESFEIRELDLIWLIA